jgi:hypothetical protein
MPFYEPTGQFFCGGKQAGLRTVFFRLEWSFAQWVSVWFRSWRVGEPVAAGGRAIQGERWLALKGAT